jgi:hypothetical protein
MTSIDEGSKIACPHTADGWDRHPEKAVPANAREDVIWFQCRTCGKWKLANRASKGV